MGFHFQLKVLVGWMGVFAFSQMISGCADNGPMTSDEPSDSASETATAPPTSAPWEEITADYRNLRGLNFIPDYPTHSAHPPENYHGSASSVAIWRFYVSEDIDEQLGHLKNIGCNAVRVWLNHAVWEAEREAFIHKLVDFFSLAESHRMHVMPILFDQALGKDPSDAAPYDDLAVWVRTPGQAATQPEIDFRSRPGGGDEYVTQVVVAVQDSPALLLWDIMNEPGDGQIDFLAHYLSLVKSLSPATPTTVGFAALLDAPEGDPFYNPLVKHEAMDVLSFHPYSLFRQNYYEWARMARAVNARENPRPKPIISSESGIPGAYQRYEEFLGYVADEGELHDGPLGFFLFQAIIGDKNYDAPFKESNGMIYPDGTVRDLEAVNALRSLALAQGGAESLPTPVLKPDTDENALPYLNIPEGWGVSEVVATLADWSTTVSPLADHNGQAAMGYVFQNDLLGVVALYLGYLVDLGAWERGLLSAEAQATLRQYQVLLEQTYLGSSANWQQLLDDGWLEGIVHQGGEIEVTTIHWFHWDDLFAEAASEFHGIIASHKLGG